MFTKKFKTVFSIFIVSFLALSSFACFDDSGSSDSGGDYYVTMKVNGTDKIFEGGYTEAGSIPIASYSAGDNETTIQAFDPSINFAAVFSAGSYGIMITDFTGNSADTCNTCTVNYIVDGVVSPALNVPVTIDTYGATGEVVSGTVSNCVAGSYTITDCTFYVKNYGNE